MISWAAKAWKTLGPREMLRQLYHYDYVKTGTLMGVDKLGNRYFENLDEQHGRHRWVEYNTELGHHDASRIQPEWHGWMHHMTDNTPVTPSLKRGMQNSWGTDVPFASEHQGTVTAEHRINPSLVRPRGYQVGSIYEKSEGMDAYYKQPGYPLHPHFESHQDEDIEEWDPTAEKSKSTKFTRARDLDAL